ncbi:MAG: fasciclin domain-containing protein [Sediminibacterium sp.]
MKKLLFVCMITVGVVYLPACSESASEKTATDDAATSTVGAGQSAVQDDASAKNVVQVAVASKDHSTLVTAVKAANLVDALSNAGPFTVFAPTNEAFAQLPAGTLDDLLKPEKIDALTDILQYHVSVGVFKAESFTDGQVIGQVNGGNITITQKGGKTYLNGTAVIVASVPASNGIIHVIDKVLLPPATK